MKTVNRLLTISERNSIAGKAGAASRWKFHQKIKTTFIRIHQDDATTLTNLASSACVSVGVLVHRVLQCLLPDQVSDITA